MQLTDVQQAMKPGARAALEKDLPYEEACRAFELTLVNEAIQATGSHRQAAFKLKMSNTWIGQLVSGKAEKRKTGRRRGPADLGKKKPAEQKA